MKGVRVLTYAYIVSVTHIWITEGWELFAGLLAWGKVWVSIHRESQSISCNPKHSTHTPVLNETDIKIKQECGSQMYNPWCLRPGCGHYSSSLLFCLMIAYAGFFLSLFCMHLTHAHAPFIPDPTLIDTLICNSLLKLIFLLKLINATYFISKIQNSETVRVRSLPSLSFSC